MLGDGPELRLERRFLVGVDRLWRALTRRASSPTGSRATWRSSRPRRPTGSWRAGTGRRCCFELDRGRRCRPADLRPRLRRPRPGGHDRRGLGPLLRPARRAAERRPTGRIAVPGAVAARPRALRRELRRSTRRSGAASSPSIPQADLQPVRSGRTRVITGVVPFRLTRRRAFALAGAATASAALRPEPAAASFTRSVPLTGAPQRVPRFDLIGLDFGRAAHVHAEVRARLGRGPWTPWTPVHDVTQPVWTGPADTFQVRHRGVARRLRAHFTRTGPAPRARPPAPPASPAPSRRSSPARAGAGTSCRPSRTRSTGRSRPASSTTPSPPTSTARRTAPASCSASAATTATTTGGTTSATSSWPTSTGSSSRAATAASNWPWSARRRRATTRSPPASRCLGDYTAGPLTEDGLDAVAQLLAWKLSLHGVPVTGEVTVTSQGGETNRYAAGRRVTLQRISGHRDGDATSCPGEALYAQLDDIRSRASAQATAVSALTIATADTTLRYPDGTVDVTGTLRLGDGTSPAGQVVNLAVPDGAGRGVDGGRRDGHGRRRGVRRRGAGAGLRPRAGRGGGAALLRRLLQRRPAADAVAVAAPAALRAVDDDLRHGVPPRRVRITVERRVGRRYYRVFRKTVGASTGRSCAASSRRAPGSTG